MSVNLVPTPITKAKNAVAFKAKRNPKSEHEPIDLSKKPKKDDDRPEKDDDRPDPTSYWETKNINKDIELFEIEPDAFYILRSAELISVPANIAVYCRAIDEAVGEMRIHYAGFVHPRFGLNREDGWCLLAHADIDNVRSSGDPKTDRYFDCPAGF